MTSKTVNALLLTAVSTAGRIDYRREAAHELVADMAPTPEINEGLNRLEYAKRRALRQVEHAARFAMSFHAGTQMNHYGRVKDMQAAVEGAVKDIQVANEISREAFGIIRRAANAEPDGPKTKTKEASIHSDYDVAPVHCGTNMVHGMAMHLILVGGKTKRIEGQVLCNPNTLKAKSLANDPDTLEPKPITCKNCLYWIDWWKLTADQPDEEGQEDG